jgi:pyridoxine 5'-phosphate synthase PdxJ
MSEMNRILKLRIVIPKDVASEGFDVDEARVAIEESVEKIVKRTMRIDDSVLCESAANQIYRTTTAFAERVDFCLGRLGDGRHVHGEEEYGRNMSEYWYSVEVYAEGEAP